MKGNGLACQGYLALFTSACPDSCGYSPQIHQIGTPIWCSSLLKLYNISYLIDIQCLLCNTIICFTCRGTAAFDVFFNPVGVFRSGCRFHFFFLFFWLVPNSLTLGFTAQERLLTLLPSHCRAEGKAEARV